MYGNQAEYQGSALRFNRGQASLEGVLLASAPDASSPNCQRLTSFTDAGHNLADDDSCQFTTGSSHNSGHAGLEPVLSHGDPVPVHLTGAGSEAINAGGDCSGRHPEDPRGVSRPQGRACDIGAAERHQHLLTVAVTGSGHVDAESPPIPLTTPLAGCTSDAGICEAAYDGEGGAAGLVRLRATPSAGWRLQGWGQDCVATDDDPATASVTVDASRHCTATFEVRQYTVSFDVQGGEPLPPISGSHGSQIQLPAATRANHDFTGWNTSADGTGSNHAAGEMLTIPAHDLTLFAQWMLETRRVTALAQGPGTISPDVQDVPHGSHASFHLAPAAGFHPSQPLGGTCPAGVLLSGNTYNTGPIELDCELEVVFLQNPAARISPDGGSAQGTPVGTAFSQPLRVRVVDAGNVPLENVEVRFTAHTGDAGAQASLAAAAGTNGGDSTITVHTGAAGIAEAWAIANANSGSHTVTAAVAGQPAAGTARFDLINQALPATLALTVTAQAGATAGSATLAATLTGDESLPFGGTVEFQVDGVTLCPAVPVHHGRAECRAASLEHGEHQATANYDGGPSHTPASAAARFEINAPPAPVQVPVNDKRALGALLLLVLLAGLSHRPSR